MTIRVWRTATVCACGLAWMNGVAVAQDHPEVPEKLLYLANIGEFPDNVCYEEGTPQDYVDAIEHLKSVTTGEEDPPGYQLTTRWSGVTGDPIELSYSLVPDGLFCDGDPSSMFATLDAQYASLGGREAWLARVDATFERWEELSGINFTRVTALGQDWDDGSSWGTSGNDTTRGDIRVSMTPIDGPSNVLGYAQFPQNGDIVLDEDESWTSETFFNNVLAHEAGHGLGMLHVCPANSTKLMEPFAGSAFSGPQHDDIRGIQRYYGDIHEGNNTSTVAPLLGTFDSDGAFSLGIPPGDDTNSGSQLSIDADGETDYFKFTVEYPGTVTVFVTPLGFVYEQGPQVGDCDTGTEVDSGDIADLGVEVRDTDGVTILASANVNGLGLFEILNDVTLDAAGTYYLRVFESNSFSFTQLYRFSLTFDLETPPPVDTDGDGVADEDDLCPGTPIGETVDSDGCSDSQLDDDGDGVSNADDLCPGTASGESVDADGCAASQLDSDGDGVSDADDLCPETPPSTPVDADGCPISEGCDGDANGDGTVDPLDAGFVSARFGCTVGGGDPLCDAADVNFDNVVDPLDVGYVLARFGSCL